MAEANLGCAGGVEPGQHDPAPIGDAIAVSVFQIQEVRRLGHEHAVAPHGDPVGVGQTRGEFRARLVASVAIGVAEPRDHPLRRGRRLAFQRIGIAAVLHYIQAKRIVERDGDRTLDERFGGNEIDAVSGLDDETRQGLVRFERQPVLRARDRALPPCPRVNRRAVACDHED
jgi:hypothetical protein